VTERRKVKPFGQDFRNQVFRAFTNCLVQKPWKWKASYIFAGAETSAVGCACRTVITTHNVGGGEGKDDLHNVNWRNRPKIKPTAQFTTGVGCIYKYCTFWLETIFTTCALYLSYHRFVSHVGSTETSRFLQVFFSEVLSKRHLRREAKWGISAQYNQQKRA